MHLGLFSPGHSMPACQGYSLASVCWPPTILEPDLFTTPQLHSAPGGGFMRLWDYAFIAEEFMFIIKLEWFVVSSASAQMYSV